MKRRSGLSVTRDDIQNTKRRRLSIAQSIEVKKEVNKQLARKTDYKQCSFNIAPTAVSTTGSSYNLFQNMTRGDGATNQYEGSNTQVKNIRIRGQFVSADSSNACRLVVVQMLDTTAPTASTILPAATTIVAPYSRRNWVNKTTYKILRDMLINFDSVGQFSQTFDLYIPGFKIRKQWWNDSVANVPTTGGIYLIAVSDSSAISHPTLVFESEIIYSD